MPRSKRCGLTDPQQLFALTAAMAFAAAAEVGAQTKAELLLADFEAAPRGLAAVHALAGRDGRGLRKGPARELPGRHRRTEAARPAVPGRGHTPGLELDALAFCLALGDTDSAPRLLELRAGLEGPRPAAICAYAAAISTDNAADHLEAAKTCEDGGTVGLCRPCLRRRGARLPGRGRHPEGAHGQSPSGSGAWTGPTTFPVSEAAKSDDSLGILTRRERDIVALAVRGLTDRQIAAELQVSVRTVEGHLYRSYAKLNVKGREQLPGIGGH